MSRQTPSSSQSSRRSFLKGAGVAAAGVIAAPTILRAVELPASGPGSIQGEGAHKYEWLHDWLKVPDHVKLGDCHGVQQSADGRIFMHHNGTPSMLVCDTEGNVMKTWGPEYKGGAHGLQLRKEGNEEFLYLALTNQHRVVKTDLDGKVVYELKVPKDSGVYPDPNKYVPTNIAFHPTNGDFYVADGYGLSYIHIYDIKGNYKSTFGGLGSEPGKMHCCHGIFTDERSGAPLLAVADRENNRIQYFTMEGKHHSFVQGKIDDGIIRRPCHFDVRGTDMLIPDLRGRITILDKDNKAVAELFDNQDPKKRANHGVPKDQRVDGQFVCPHGAIWDAKGDIYVVEWIVGGRVTKLRHVA
jgi:hypothetical protein